MGVLSNIHGNRLNGVIDMKLRHSVIFLLSIAVLFMLSIIVWKLDQKTVDRWYGRNGMENRQHIQPIEKFLADKFGYKIPEWDDGRQ